ncbi:MAG: hypothetical protein VX124_08930, partial [Pseudomonadota bacterium]|nr:hypothetical protein [Pseudomonadota bacterium]
YGGINFALYPLALAHTNDYLSAEQVVPAAAGMILAYSLGASIGPFLAGQTMATVGPEGLFIYTAAVMHCSVPSRCCAQFYGGRSPNHGRGVLSRCRA